MRQVPRQDGTEVSPFARADQYQRLEIFVVSETSMIASYCRQRTAGGATSQAV